jgi:glucosamine--fructose-6-phosphate aminotransferase (isomerizing)
MNPYIANILEQPAALHAAIDRFDAPALAGMRAASFERIVLTGMGGSHFAAYPLWLALTQAGLPAWHVESSELLHQHPRLVNRKTLLIMTSQSGRSAEVLALLDKVVPAQVLAITNSADNPLAQCANAVLQIHAGDEATVSTKTYLNSVATLAQVGSILTNGALTQTQAQLRETAAAVDRYLADWQARAAEVADAVGLPERLFLLGRGALLASAWAGALVLKESAKINAEGLSAGQFRHGPLELADARMTALIFAGDGPGAALNRKLAADLRGFGVRTISASSDSDADLRLLAASGDGLPIAAMLAVQLLSLSIAERTGFVPGQFRNAGKITATE